MCTPKAKVSRMILLILIHCSYNGLSFYMPLQNQVSVIYHRSYINKKKLFVNIDPWKHKRKILTLSTPPLYSTSNNSSNKSEDNDEMKNIGDDNTNNKTTGRAGGRKSTFSNMVSNEVRSPSILGSQLTRLLFNLLPWIIVFALLKSILGFLLFGGLNSKNSYVYYQSTVYETRSYGPDGKLERTRKESVRSNIPSLVNGERNIQDQNGDGETLRSSYLLQNDPDDDFDKELGLLMPRSIRLDDFF